MVSVFLTSTIIHPTALSRKAPLRMMVKLVTSRKKVKEELGANSRE